MSAGPDAVPEEPVIPTPLLDMLVERQLVFDGESRQRVANRLRDNVRARRTPTSLGTRLSGIISEPFEQAIRQATEERVQERLQDMRDRRAQE